MMNTDRLEEKAPIVGGLRKAEEVTWINPLLESTEEAMRKIGLT